MSNLSLDDYLLLNIGFRSCVLLLVTLAVALIFRRKSAAVVHRIWSLGVFGCLLIPIVTLFAPNWKLPILPATALIDGPTTEVATTDIATVPSKSPVAAIIPGDTGFSSSAPGFQPVPMRRMSRSETTQYARGTRGSADEITEQQRRTAAPSQINWPSLESWFWIAWWGGLTIVLLRIARQLLLAQRTVRQCTVIEDESWHKLRDAAADQLGLQKKVAMMSHPGAVSPMVAGILRPVVILPTDAQKWSSERRTLVLLHELAHVQRRDVLTQTIAGAVCALYWFNPLGWWAAIQMRRLREIAADDTVVALTARPRAYAQTLLDVAKGYRSRQQISMVAMARTNNVAGRIAAVLDATRRRASLTKRSARLIGAAALFLSVLVGALQLSTRADDPQDGQKSLSEKDNKSRSLVIRVLNEVGQPLSEVNVYVSGIDIERKRSLPRKNHSTNAKGEVEITFPHGPVRLQIWPSRHGYVPQYVGFKDSEEEEGNAIPKEYEFHFQPGVRLSGVVVDANAVPIVGAKVQVKVAGKVELNDKSKQQTPQARVSGWLALGGDAAVSDEEGRWEINNAPAPTVNSEFGFRLMVTHPEFSGDRRWGEYQEQQGITTEQLRAGTARLTMDRGTVIAGSISGPNGEPITKGLVIWDDRPYWAEGVNEAQIDVSGKYETLRLAPGNYPVTVLAPGYAPEQRMVSLSQSLQLQQVDFQLEPGNPIKLQIVDHSGKPIPNARVHIENWRRTEAIYNHKHPNVPLSGIPRRADQNGMYVWDWAPSDGVKYRIGAEGYNSKNVTLVAKQDAHRIELVLPIVIFGNVVDAESGEPIENFRVVPVKAFRPDFYSTDFQEGSVDKGKDGNYKIQIDSYGESGRRHRVRIEADGYRTALGQKSLAAGEPSLKEDFELERSPAQVGTVVDLNGSPVDHFTVAIGTPTTSPSFRVEDPDTSFGQAFQVKGKRQFELPATFEPQRIRVFNDSGFAEVLRHPDEPIGTIILQPWASVSGRLVQDGEPIPNESIYFYPFASYQLTEARFQDSYAAKTDRNGYFSFDRLPPTVGRVRAYLGPWRDSVLTSSQSIPMNLKPGDRKQVLLGGTGLTVTGRVVATGRSNDELSKQWSLNSLISRERGVAYRIDEKPLSFSGSGAVDASWLREPDFNRWRSTREHHFVKLSDDGRLRIHGVRPGTYDLVIQLYEQPSGCLVETIGEEVIPVTITEEQLAAGELDLGNIDVKCRIGPRPGADMRSFKFTDSDGRVRIVNDLSGRYVLFHVWASWCKPCLASMPEVKSAVEKHADDRLTVVGLNIDSNTATARSLARDGEWNWAQNYLGDDSDMMLQLAVSTVPAYYLIGPDGKLVGSANTWKQIRQLLDTRLR